MNLDVFRWNITMALFDTGRSLGQFTTESFLRKSENKFSTKNYNFTENLTLKEDKSLISTIKQTSKVKFFAIFALHFLKTHTQSKIKAVLNQF